MRRSMKGLLVVAAGLVPTLALADGNCRREEPRFERHERFEGRRFDDRAYGRREREERFEHRRFDERRDVRVTVTPAPYVAPGFAVGTFVGQLPFGAQTYVVAGVTYAYSSTNYFQYDAYRRSWLVVPAPLR